MFYSMGGMLGVANPQNIMQQIYLAITSIAGFVFACALLLF